jgi:hypothetical protein
MHLIFTPRCRGGSGRRSSINLPSALRMQFDTPLSAPSLPGLIDARPLSIALGCSADCGAVTESASPLDR